MTSFVAVLPSIWTPYTEACLESMGPRLRAGTLVVDNTVENRGVPVSWNLGVDRLEAEAADWLILLSAAVRFGRPGGDDFLDALPAHPEAVAVEAHPGFGWHCIALSGWALEAVGRFDTNFWPGYWEDNDWAHRARCRFGLDPTPPGYWPKVDLDAVDVGWAHAVQIAGVEADPVALMAYYEAKWGGLSPDEKWTTPFGDPSLPLDYQPPPTGPGRGSLLPS